MKNFQKNSDLSMVMFITNSMSVAKQKKVLTKEGGKIINGLASMLLN